MNYKNYKTMKTQLKIIRFWIGANYNQVLIILTLVYVAGQMIRVVI